MSKNKPRMLTTKEMEALRQDLANTISLLKKLRVEELSKTP